MKSTDGRSSPNMASVKKNAGKKLIKNASLALDSKASSGANMSEAAGAARSNNAKPSLSTSSSCKASAGGKASKAPSVARSRDAALKAGVREGGAIKTLVSGERLASREPSGKTIEKNRANTSGGKTDRVDKAPSGAGWLKNLNDGATKAVAKDDGTSSFGSAESVVFVTAESDKAEGGKQELPRQENVTKKKDQVVTKEKDVPSPATSSTQVPPVMTEEKTPAAQDTDAKTQAAKASDKRPSTSSTKSNARNRELKNTRKKRGPSRGNKAVQTNPEDKKEPTGPPIHVLFSPSSCSLCESNAPPPSFYGAMQPFQVGKYGALMAAPSVVTSAQGPPRGVVKKTVRTTTTTRRVPDSTRAPRSYNLVEEVTTEDVRETADDTDKTKATASTSAAGKVNSGVATKKTVTTTRRLKDHDKTRKNSDATSGVEPTITEMIEFSESAAKRGSAEKQADGARPAETSVLEYSTKRNAASVAPKKIVRTVRRAKNADPLGQDDVIETVTTEVVEVESEASSAQPAQQTAAPIIVGVARDPSATKYRYSESRRLASTPYRAPRKVGAVNQHMQLRPPRFWSNQPHRQIVASYSRPFRHGVLQHLPACRFAAFSRRGISAWEPPYICQGHHGHSCHPPPYLAPTVAHGPSSSCPGLAGTRLQPQCAHYDDDIPVTANCSVAPTAVPQSANVRSVGNSSDPSEGTYDVFYEGAPDPVPANAGGIRNEVPRRPTEFIWETPPREELVYCANVVASPTAHHAEHAANGPRGATCNEDVNGHNHDGVDARAAPAVTDLSMTAGSQVTSKCAGYERSTSVKTQEMHPRQQSQRLPAQSMVDKATNTILDEAVPKTTKYSPVSSSARRFASREHLAIIDQDNSSQDTNEITPNEETFLYRDDITGAGETAEQRILGEGAKRKPRKKSHHRSKTVTKDLVFSISPRMATGGGLMTAPFGKPDCAGAVADAMTYSATRFSYDGQRPAEQPAISEPRLTILPHPEVSVDPFSASIPCSTENLIWLPPLTGTDAKRASEDGYNRMLNAKFAVVASATQGYHLRRESSGTMYEVGGPRSRQCRKSANTLPTVSGSGSNTYTITEAMHPDHSVPDTANPENEQIRSVLLQTGEVNENEYRISTLVTSQNDSVVLAEGRALKKDGKDENSGTFCSSDGKHKNLFHVRPSFRRNLEPSLQRDTDLKENNTYAGVFIDVKERDVQRERSAKAFSSLPPLDAQTAYRTYGRCSPAGAISQSVVPENMFLPSSSNRLNNQVMPTQVFNCDAGPALHTEEKPADNLSSLFTRENAYIRRTSLTAISHAVMYQTYHSKQSPQLQTERRYLPIAAVGLNREAVLRELPTHGRSQDGTVLSPAREHEMQVKHSSSHATSGVELITSCRPSHSVERPHEACNVARKRTSAVTRGSTIMLDGVANRRNDTSRGIESFDSSLKSAVPAFSPVCLSKSAEFCDGNVCEQVAQDTTWRPVPHPRTIHVPNKARELKKKKLTLDRAPYPRKLSAGSTKGEPSDFRDDKLKSKSFIADEVRVKQGTTQDRTQAVVDVRKGVDISEEGCSFNLRKALTSNTNIQTTSRVQDSGDTAVAGKISIPSKVLKMNIDNNGLPDIPTSLTANVEPPAERKDISDSENDCHASVEVKAKNGEMILKANVAPDHLTIGKCEYSGNETVKTADHCGLLGNEEVYTNAGSMPKVEVSPSLGESSRISGKSDRLLHTEIAVATVVSLTCLVWIAEVYPTSRQEVPDILQIHNRNTTESSFAGVTFETFWYTTGSKITTTSTFKPLTRSYLCSSDFCLQEAAYINGAISEDVSPCDNFYQHVCSKWESKISLSAVALGVSASVDTVVDEYMSSMLTDYILLKKNEDTRLPRFLYKTCMSPHQHSSVFIRSQVFSALPIRTWPFNGSMGSVEVWRTAGIIVRKYGVTALLNVVVGAERTTNMSIVELELPHSLFFSGDESRPGVKRMFVEAIREVATEFNQTSMAANLTTQIMEIFKGLAKVTDKPVVTPRTCRVRKLKHIDYSVRTFVTAVFNGDISPDATVIVRNSDAILGGLVRLTHNLDVQHFLNYLGFRLLVRLALLLPEHLVNMRHLFSVEFTGRVVREDLKWLLCMRLAEAVAPPCLENVQVSMFKEMGTLTLARRFWLLQMEDFFSRNLRHLAWISEKTLSFMEKKLNHYKFVHVSFEKAPRNDPACKSLRDLRASRRRLKKSQLVPALLATWETYQAMYLKQTTRGISPRDQGILCESNPRLIRSLQTVYVPPGLVNASVPENSTMLAFHLSRVATRLFRALVPLVSVEDGQCYGPSAMTQQSQRSLARLRKCLAKDAQSLPSQLQPRASDVLWDGEGQEGEAAGFAILAQTAALGLAFAAFKEMLRVDRIWRFNFRFVSLPNVSAEQLFFLYYALDNCELSDRTHRAHEYSSWRRLPAEQRVNLPLRQMAHFAEAFGCASGRSAMAPADRCGVLRWPAPRPDVRDYNL